MKKVKYLLIVLVLFFVTQTEAQVINWASLKKEQKNIVNINAGAEYGLIYGAGYAYQLKTKKPLLINLAYSFPSGNKLTDDFKTKAGAELLLYHTANFGFSVKLQGIFRRFENSYVRLLNFGSDLSGVFGYYKKKWFAAGELGFDKAIVTNFKHSSAFKANFPGVQDGWFDPSTGGNLYYGIRTGLSFKRNDLYLRAGKLTQQDFKTSPLLPFYTEIGVNFRFGK